MQLARLLCAKGYGEATITAALLAENASRCEPPKPENKVRQLSHDIFTRYPAGTTAANQEPTNPWEEAEDLGKFLESGEDEADFLDPERRILARASVMEIFSPRGLGKSLYAIWLAVQLVRRGLRVMLIDRDNPRYVVRSRLKGFGAESKMAGLKVMSRERCPPLTNAGAWARFPYADYDVVMLDSFDSAAEGVGEQDSAKPSRALAPLLDIARRENGPAVVVLGNCVRSGKHSRGSGVIEDRPDIVYEVRDATDLLPSGLKPWLQELPPADAASWLSRSWRRKQREKFRLAFTSTKFRLGPEPEPFVLEIDLATVPWTVADMTDEVDREGAGAREQRACEHADRIATAKAALQAEILRRASAGESPLLKEVAIRFLIAKPHNLRRTDAREVANNPDGRWTLGPSGDRKGIPFICVPLEETERTAEIQSPQNPRKHTEGARPISAGRMKRARRKRTPFRPW